MGYVNDPICPYVFIKQSEFGIAIVAVYVNDLNLIGTPKELQKTVECLKNEFEMNNLGKIRACSTPSPNTCFHFRFKNTNVIHVRHNKFRK